MSFYLNQSMEDSFPPYAVEDNGSKQLSWSSVLVQKLVKRSEILQSRERDTGSVADMSFSQSESSLFSHPLEESLCEQVVTIIAQSLNNASDHILRCSKLVLPDRLLQNIQKELLHLSASEPCGLRGAQIDVCVEEMETQQCLCTVDQIVVDPSLVPTFQLTLVLRPDIEGLWPKIRRLLKGNKHTQTQNVTRRHVGMLRLSAGFRAIKRKLYSSGDLLIEECC